MFELIFTSLPKGLFPGKSGFSTVAMTQGMPPNLISPLENLSGYNFTYSNNQLPAELNPVCCYYIKMRYGNQQLYIAGRVAPNGLDYSRRNNKIAHHILLESPEELACPDGAAGLFTTGSIDQFSTRISNGNFVTDFQRDPCELGYRELPAGSEPASMRADTWAGQTGEAAAAAWVADRFSNNPDMPVYIKYDAATTDVQVLLDLAREVCILLNPADRTDFTFNTYFNTASPGTECFLRFVPSFSPLLSTLERFQKDSLITLDTIFPAERLDEVQANDLIELARTGARPALKVEPERVFVSTPNVPETPSTPELPSTTPAGPSMPEVPNAPLTMNHATNIGTQPFLQRPNVPIPQYLPQNVNINKEHKIGNNSKNLIMLVIFAVILVSLLLFMFIPKTSDNSSSSSSGANSDNSSSKKLASGSGEKKPDTPSAQNNLNKAGNSSTNSRTEQKKYRLEFDKDGRFIYKDNEKIIDNGVIKIQVVELQLQEMPPLPLKTYKSYVQHVEKINRFKEHQSPEGVKKPSELKQMAEELRKKYGELIKSKYAPEKLEEFDDLFSEYRKELYKYYAKRKEISKNRCEEFNKERLTFKRLPSGNTTQDKKVLQYTERWERDDNELGEYLAYRVDPDKFGSKTQKKFENEFKKLSEKFPSEAQDILKNYFAIKDPQSLTDEKLKNLAEELEKFIEFTVQTKKSDSPKDAAKKDKGKNKSNQDTPQQTPAPTEKKHQAGHKSITPAIIQSNTGKSGIKSANK